jgi:hypothetical protein
MGAGKFYAAHAARAKADPVEHALNLATLKHERQVRDLKAEHAAAIAELQHEFAAGAAALRQAQANADRQQQQFEVAHAAWRQELETTRAALNEAKTQNEQLRGRIKQCAPLLALIDAAATRQP